MLIVPAAPLRRRRGDNQPRRGDNQPATMSLAPTLSPLSFFISSHLAFLSMTPHLAKCHNPSSFLQDEFAAGAAENRGTASARHSLAAQPPNWDSDTMKSSRHSLQIGTATDEDFLSASGVLGGVLGEGSSTTPEDGTTSSSSASFLTAAGVGSAGSALAQSDTGCGVGTVLILVSVGAGVVLVLVQVMCCGAGKEEADEDEHMEIDADALDDMGVEVPKDMGRKDEKPKSGMTRGS